MTQRGAMGLDYTVAFALADDSVGQIVALTITSTPAGILDGPDALSQARGRVVMALREGYDKCREDNAKWWGGFWGISSVSIPDAGLQNQYDLCKYFYGAASASDAPPIPLQGVWTCDNGDLPPWKGDYHNDLNTQMTYLAYPEAGLFEQGESFLNLNERLLKQYRNFARSFYDVPGAVVPGVMTLGGKATGGWGQYSLSPTNGAWVAQIVLPALAVHRGRGVSPFPGLPLLRSGGGGAPCSGQSRRVRAAQVTSFIITGDL